MSEDVSSRILLHNTITGAVRAFAWISLRDGAGNIYFANLNTHQTRWFPPALWMHGWIERGYDNFQKYDWRSPRMRDRVPQVEADRMVEGGAPYLCLAGRERPEYPRRPSDSRLTYPPMSDSDIRQLIDTICGAFGCSYLPANDMVVHTQYQCDLPQTCQQLLNIVRCTRAVGGLVGDLTSGSGTAGGTLSALSKLLDRANLELSQSGTAPPQRYSATGATVHEYTGKDCLPHCSVGSMRCADRLCLILLWLPLRQSNILLDFFLRPEASQDTLPDLLSLSTRWKL